MKIINIINNATVMFDNKGLYLHKCGQVGDVASALMQAVRVSGGNGNLFVNVLKQYDPGHPTIYAEVIKSHQARICKGFRYTYTSVDDCFQAESGDERTGEWVTFYYGDLAGFINKYAEHRYDHRGAPEKILTRNKTERMLLREALEVFESARQQYDPHQLNKDVLHSKFESVVNELNDHVDDATYKLAVDVLALSGDLLSKNALPIPKQLKADHDNFWAESIINVENGLRCRLKFLDHMQTHSIAGPRS